MNAPETRRLRLDHAMQDCMTARLDIPFLMVAGRDLAGLTVRARDGRGRGEHVRCGFGADHRGRESRDNLDEPDAFDDAQLGLLARL